MQIVNAYTKMLKNYAVFSGRTSAPDYWWAVLGNVIIGAILGALSRCFPSLDILVSLYSLALLLPGLGLCFRRLHDVGKSGWNLFFLLIPLVGWIVLIVFLAKPSQNDENQYGPCGASV